MYSIALWLVLFCGDDLPYWWVHPQEVLVELCLKFAPSKKVVNGIVSFYEIEYWFVKGEDRVETARMIDYWEDLKFAHLRTRWRHIDRGCGS